MRPTIVAPVLMCMSLGLAATAAARPPVAADFAVEYLIPEPGSDEVRVMSEQDRRHYFNRARCECGQPIRARVRLVGASGDLDDTVLITAMIGTQCPVAEVPGSQFGRCGELVSAAVPAFVTGVEVDVHPLFLASGVDATSPTRAVDDPTTTLPSGCTGSQGSAGVWLCAETNGVAGCQPEEFIVTPNDDGPDQAREVYFDNLGPINTPQKLAAEPGDGGVSLGWQVQPGDSNGFRVLCELADSGEPVPGRDIPPPDRFGALDGTGYFTADDLCGDPPFTSVRVAGEAPDGGVCGDGRVGPDEQCDDGDDNRSGGLCSASCRLNVSPGLHALSWDYLCTPHIDINERSVVIDGLENGTTYNFVLVTHDSAGNPRAVATVVQTTPSGEFAGPEGDESGCGCTGAPTGRGSALLLLLLAPAALRRRRRPLN